VGWCMLTSLEASDAERYACGNLPSSGGLMRVVLLTLSWGLAACSSSPISQYCASLAMCSMDDCELSAEACEELRQGEQDACEAELKATRDVIATGDDAACTTCVEAMDQYYNCAADIPTCTDFANAQTEDCDGEYQEYVGACTPQVQAECGQKSAQDTGATTEAMTIDCPDICDDEVRVHIVSSIELTLYDITMSFNDVTLTFQCKNEGVRQLSNKTYDVTCGGNGFTLAGVTPSVLEVSMNGIYSATLQATYVSEHPTEGCDTACLAADVDWWLGI
jgi:hypothetical protein